MTTMADLVTRLSADDIGFGSRLRRQWASGRHLCVGLDPDYDQLPDSARRGHTVAEAIGTFNRDVVEATADHVCAYKTNLAFYEAHGSAGYEALVETVSFIKWMLP